MSSEIENQIVSMQFDNKQFESGVNTSLGTIDRLKNSLNFSTKTGGLNDLQVASSRLDLSNADKQVSTITHHLNLLKTAGLVAFATLVRQATYAGEHVLASFTIDPIKAGFQNYETKINAVQTILSNTADQGTNLKQVTGILNQLNKYANQTVYNFSEMAKNIGTFTAAGVDLKTSTASIKGIANLAALSGSTSEQASSAMYQLSQAIAAGQVHLQDWNSVVNAGIGGAVFQKNLIQTALATGTLDKNQVHLGKTMKDTTINGVAFRQSLTPPPGGTSWLTSGVLTSSLSTFTGDLTKAQLVAKGFTKDQAAAIVAQGKRAQNAATQIKTFSQLFQALKEEVASAYSNVFEALFGNINEAKKFLSPLHTVLENALTSPINGIASALRSWRKAGGFEDILKIFSNLGKVVSNLFYPIKVLFAPLIPSTKHAGSGLEKFTKGVAIFTGWLVKVTSFTRKFTLPLQYLGDIFVFIGHVIGDVISQFKKLAPVFDVIGGKVNELEQNFAGIASQILAGIGSGLIRNESQLKKTIENLGTNIINWIKDILGIHSPAATMIPIGLNIVQGIAQGIIGAAQWVIKALQKVFVGIGKTVAYMAKNISWSDVLDSINTGLFLGVVLLFRNFVKAFSGTMKSFRELMEKGGGVLDQITSNLKTMQQKVKSEIIRNIAISVALLAASALLLSTIDSKKLGLAIGAIAGLMSSLVASMAIMTHGAGKGSVKDAVKQMAALSSVSKALIAFSASVLILTGAVALMGQLDPKTIEKGLAGVAGVISIIVAATAILSKTGGGATILATATAMLIMSASLTAFVGVMKLYEKLDWKTLVRGGGAAAAVILAIGLAMRGFGKGAVGGATGLIIASAALVVLAKAMQMLASIGLGDMIKSVIALDLILGTLVAAANGMSAAEGGAGSMLVMAAAIIVLAEALNIIAKIPFWDLVKAIGALVVSLALIAGASIVLAPAVPLIAALGTAVLLLGGAVLAAGLGILAFATAMGILAVVGPAAFQSLHDGIGKMLEVLPEIGKAIGGFIVSILQGFVEAAGPLTKAIGKLIGILIDAVINLIPKLKKLAEKLVHAILDVIANSYGYAGKVMLRFVLKLLDTLNDGVPKLIKKGSDLIIAVITGLGREGVKIANATGKAILSFLKGLDKAIVKYEPQIIAEGVKISGDMVDGVVKGLTSALSWSKIKGAVEKMAGFIPGWAKKVLGIGSPSRVMADEVGKWIPLGVAGGIDDHSSAVERSARDMANKAFNALDSTFSNSKRAVNGLGDLKPKITPILDLAQLEKDASRIGGMMGSHSISTDVSRRQARNLASAQNGKSKSEVAHDGDTYNFHQTINSPKPVNPIKVYRGTKSQIALFKEVTGK